MIVEGVVALCMFIQGELKEHRIQPAMSVIVLKAKESRSVIRLILLIINAVR